MVSQLIMESHYQHILIQYCSLTWWHSIVDHCYSNGYPHLGQQCWEDSRAGTSSIPSNTTHQGVSVGVFFSIATGPNSKGAASLLNENLSQSPHCTTDSSFYSVRPISLCILYFHWDLWHQCIRWILFTVYHWGERISSFLTDGELHSDIKSGSIHSFNLCGTEDFILFRTVFIIKCKLFYTSASQTSESLVRCGLGGNTN